jgi:hypothetical protein
MTDETKETREWWREWWMESWEKLVASSEHAYFSSEHYNSPANMYRRYIRVAALPTTEWIRATLNEQTRLTRQAIREEVEKINVRCTHNKDEIHCSCWAFAYERLDAVLNSKAMRD